MCDAAPNAVISSIGRHLDAPTALGLARAVSHTIRDGVLRPGGHLPPIRSLARELKLSPTTVSAAWRLLARSGTIRTDGRHGTTVADPSRIGSPRYERALDRRTQFALDLSTGVPDAALLPDLSKAVESLRAAITPSSYLDEPVLPQLLEVLRRDWPHEVEDLTVVDGAMDGIELATRVLVRFGDRVVVEHPTFPPLLDLLEANGAEVVGVPMDEDGMRTRDLQNAIAAGPVVAVYLQPRAQNPTGVSLSAKRGRELAAVLRGSDAMVIEDDSSGAVASAEPISLGRWRPERTVHVRSFAKSHGPDLRLAALSGPADLLGRIVALRRLGQGWSSRLLQHILLNLLTTTKSIEAVDAAREEYSRRRNLLVTALTDNGVEVGGKDGINIWVEVKDETAAVVRLASQGIGVTPGSPFEVLTSERHHVRVTAGLLASGHTAVARAIAEAARGSVTVGV